MTSILQLDIAGNPSGWITPHKAIHMSAGGRVIASLGDEDYIFKGGINRISGLRTTVTVGSIILTKERVISNRLAKGYVPPLTNKGLFSRDKNTCLYCGHTFPTSKLTRDHIVPKAQKFDESWTNSATACKPCNNKKDNKTPEQWGRLLLAVPFTPNWAEFLFLKNSTRIKADQHAFLLSRFPKGSLLV